MKKIVPLTILILSVLLLISAAQSSKTKWEYKALAPNEIVALHVEAAFNESTSDKLKKASESIETKLNKYGSEGWEVVAIHPVILLKRQKK